MITVPAFVILSAMLAGACLGLLTPGIGTAAGSAVDVTIFALLVLIFLPVRMTVFRQALANLRFTATAWLTNFLLVAPFGALVAWLIFGGHPAAMIGLIIYFSAPCTDWFLGFTKIARGATADAAALIPLNLVTQAVGFSLILWLLTDTADSPGMTDVLETMLTWFAGPLVVAAVLRACLAALEARRALAPNSAARHSDALTPAALGLLVFQIFAANMDALTTTLPVAPLILCAVAMFFAFSFVAARIAARLTALSQPQCTALLMTASARNAPLMLALTMSALPDQPLVYAVIIVAMLAEFPHLTMLSQMLRHRAEAQTRASPAPVAAAISNDYRY